MNNEFPQTFGKYLLLDRVAIGGMAEIFRATPLSGGQGKEICVKRILPHYSDDEEFIKMFIDEANIAAQLNHPGIVEIYDFAMEGECYYIAMELVVGRDLKQTLEAAAKAGQHMPPDAVAYVAREVASALGHAHSKTVDGKPLNIIHRDVSPHNVIVAFNGDVKLTDFGIAKAASRLTHTSVGTVKGKCAYMSPEQARGRTLDGRSDLFSIGILMHEMLTGRRLFGGESDFDVLTKVLKEEIVPPSEYGIALDPELERITLKALERDRKKRYSSGEQMAQELDNYLRSQGISETDCGAGPFMCGLFGVPRPAGARPSPSGNRPAVSQPVTPITRQEPSTNIADMATQMLSIEDMKAGLDPAGRATMPMEGVPGPLNQPPVDRPRMIIPAPSNQGADDSLHSEKTAMLSLDELRADGSLPSPDTPIPQPAPVQQPPPQAYTPPPQRHSPPPQRPVKKKKSKSTVILLLLLLFLLLFGVVALAGVAVFVFADDLGLKVASTDTAEEKSGKDKEESGDDEEEEGGDDAKALTAKGSEEETGDKDNAGGDEAGKDEEDEKEGDGEEAKGDAEEADGDTEEAKGDAEEEEEKEKTADIRVETTPPGATVFIGEDKQDDVTPMTLAKMKIGEELTVTFKLDGHKEAEVKYKVEEAGKIEETLEKKEEKKELTAAEKAERRRIAEQRRKERQAAKGFGTVTINAYPWAEVYLDGKKLGRTPIRGHKVSAGGHSVLLKNPELNAKVRKRFSVKKDATQTVFHSFK